MNCLPPLRGIKTTLNFFRKFRRLILSWIYILKKQSIRYSESHKELASLVAFSAMRESNARRQGDKKKK